MKMTGTGLRKTHPICYYLPHFHLRMDEELLVRVKVAQRLALEVGGRLWLSSC